MKALALSLFSVVVLSFHLNAIPVAIKFNLSSYTYELSNERQSYKNQNGSAIIHLKSEGEKPCVISLHFTSIWSFDLQDIIEVNETGNGLKPYFLAEASTESWSVSQVHAYLPENKLSTFLDLLRNHTIIEVMVSWDQDSKSAGSVSKVEHVKVNLTTETIYQNRSINTRN